MNNDDICLARAVVTAKAILDQHPKVATIKKGDQGYQTSEQKRLAEQLMTDVGLGNLMGPCGLDEVVKIQELLGVDYQIKIFARDALNDLVFKGRYLFNCIYHVSLILYYYRLFRP